MPSLAQRTKALISSSVRIDRTYPQLSDQPNPRNTKPPLVESSPDVKALVSTNPNPKIAQVEPFEMIEIAAKHGTVPDAIRAIAQITVSSDSSEIEKIRAINAILRCTRKCLDDDTVLDGEPNEIKIKQKILDTKSALADALNEIAADAKMRSVQGQLDNDPQAKKELLKLSSDLEALSERITNLSSTEYSLRSKAERVVSSSSSSKMIAVGATSLFGLVSYLSSFIDFDSTVSVPASIVGSSIAGLIIYLRFRRKRNKFRDFVTKSSNEISATRELLLKQLKEF